jgi:preprotein translocase subunit SecB
VSYRVATSTSAEARTGQRPTVELEAELEWVDADGVECSGPFNLTVAVQGDFDVSAGPREPDEIEELLRFTGRYLLWPYVRSYVSAVTALSSHPPLTLFTLQVPAPRVLDPTTGEFDAATTSSDS